SCYALPLLLNSWILTDLSCAATGYLRLHRQTARERLSARKAAGAGITRCRRSVELRLRARDRGVGACREPLCGALWLLRSGVRSTWHLRCWPSRGNLDRNSQLEEGTMK